MIHGVVAMLVYVTTCTQQGCDEKHDRQGFQLPLGVATPAYNPPPGWHIIDGRVLCPKHEIIVGTMPAMR